MGLKTCLEQVLMGIPNKNNNKWCAMESLLSFRQSYTFSIEIEVNSFHLVPECFCFCDMMNSLRQCKSCLFFLILIKNFFLIVSIHHFPYPKCVNLECIATALFQSARPYCAVLGPPPAFSSLRFRGMQRSSGGPEPQPGRVWTAAWKIPVGNTFPDNRKIEQ